MAIDRLRVLCGKGYFPVALPRTFTSADFGTYIREILAEWAANGFISQDFRSPERLSSMKDTDSEVFSAPKGNRERRLFHIVHPLSQAMIADIISRNWHTIAGWTGRSKYSFNNLDIVTNSDRAISYPDFTRHRAHKESIVAVCNWITETDITRFYPSIYTHSIDWAAYGKETYKRNPRKYRHSLADQLDIAVRKCNRNQTVGIPIGPDTSRIIAEIISAYVDTSVHSSTGLTKADADRLQDDWLIGSSSLEQAEARLSGVIRAYQEVGLDINGRKTGIKHVSEASFPGWKAAIMGARAGGPLAGERLSEMLRVAISAQIAEPSESVLPYVFAMLMGTKIPPEDLRVLQSFVTRAVAVDPRVIDDACILLLNLNHEGYRLDKERISARFVPLLEAALEAGHSFEAVWTLHLFRGLRLGLQGSRVAQLADVSEGSAVRLVMLDLEANGLLDTLPKRNWQRKIAASSLYDPEWLLGYEGVRHGWLSDPASALRNHPFLAPMFARNVQFYDPKRNVPSRATIKRARTERARLSLRLALTDWSPYLPRSAG